MHISLDSVFAVLTTTAAIVSSLSTAYDIKINILEANIKIQNGTVGFLVLHIPYISSVDFGKFERNGSSDKLNEGFNNMVNHLVKL